MSYEQGTIGGGGTDVASLDAARVLARAHRLFVLRTASLVGLVAGGLFAISYVFTR